MNGNLDVVWDTVEERVHVLVDGRPVLYCAFLIANVSQTDSMIQSIDDLVGINGARKLEGREVRRWLSVEEEVFAHASNIQAWVEFDYNTRMIHSNIAFPLLKALVKVGDEKAKRVLDAELVERMKDATPATMSAILESCADLLDAPVIEDQMGKFNQFEQADIWNCYSCNMTFEGKTDLAVAAAKKAIALSPNIALFQATLGEALEARGDLDGAALAYIDALSLDGNESWSIEHLTRIFKENKGRLQPATFSNEQDWPDTAREILLKCKYLVDDPE